MTTVHARRIAAIAILVGSLLTPAVAQLAISVDPDQDGTYQKIREYPVTYEEAIAAFAAAGGSPWNGTGPVLNFEHVAGVELQGQHSWDGLIAFLDERYPTGGAASFAPCDTTIAITNPAGITWSCDAPLDCLPQTDCEGQFTNGRLAHAGWSCLANGDPVCPGAKPTTNGGTACECDINDDCLVNPGAVANGGGIMHMAGVCKCTQVGIPTVSEWGIVGLTLLVLAVGTVVLRRRSAASAV
jgi:hypothetical protein